MSESDLDSFNEIDFDSVHGTSLTDPSKPLVLYWDRKKAMDCYERQKSKSWIFDIEVYLVSLLPALVGIILWNTQPQFLTIPLAALMFIASIYMVISSIISLVRIDYAFRYDITNSMNPILEILPEGIGIHCPFKNFDLIPWSEIKEVRAETVFSWRSLRIIPKDPEYVLSLESEDPSLSVRSRRRKQPSGLAMAIKMHKRKGIFRLPLPKELREISIDVPEQWLPFSADEVAEFINIRLARYKIEGGN